MRIGIGIKNSIFTSKDSVMEEIVSPCAIYFDPTSEKSIANTIKSFYFSKSLTTFTQEQEEARVNYAMLSQFSLSKRAES